MATTTEEERELARQMRSSDGATEVKEECDTGSTLLDGLAGCELDENAVQKYVLIRAASGEKHRFLVRGNKRAEYHMHAAEDTVEYLKTLPSVAYEVIGGGRIKHEGANIHIYGHSYGFPWRGDPKHDVSAKVVQIRYPEAIITTSDEGY